VSLTALLRRGAAPVEFYRFQYVGNDTALARWTGSDVGREFFIAGAIHPTGGDILEIYLPAPVVRDDVEGTEERAGASLRITLPIDHVETNTIVDLYRAGVAPVTPVEVCVYRAHRGHRDVARLFYGNITSPEFSDAHCVLNVEPKSGMLRHPLLRQKFQAPCNNTLYDQFCGVNRGSFSAAATVSAIAADGVTLTVPEADAQPDGYYGAGGLLQFGSRYGFIREHTGPTLVLLTPVPGLAASSSVTISAGCDRTLATCRDRFSNTPNHQGFPFTPTEDPFRHGVRR
jgi:uncharacterized phage protein (TIGR02218 family)